MKKLLFIILSVTFTSFTSYAGSFVLNDYSLVTIESFESTSGHVYGSAFVGGDLTGNSVEFGSRITRNTDTEVLTVTGTVSNSSITVYNNDVVVNEDKNTITTKDNGNKFDVNGLNVETATDVSYVSDVTGDTDLYSLRDDYAAQLISASAAFAQLETNSDLSIDTDTRVGVFDITDSLTTDDYAVFSLDGDSSLFTDTAGLNFQMTSFDNLSDLAGIIINVSGTLIDFSNSSMTEYFTQSSYYENIIWNFYEATDIDLGANLFNGTLLAPYATVSTNNDINGSVGVKSLILEGQIHLTGTDVSLPTTTTTTVEVPEPAHLFLMVIAIVGILVKRRTLNI